MDNISIFTSIYENKVWADNKHKNYSGSSGEGSSVYVNYFTYIPFLKKFILENNIKSISDLGCGDFRCGKLIYDDLDIIYNGYDAYNKVVENNKLENPNPKYNFYHLDFCNNKDKIITGDLCILKDVLQHWRLQDITDFLDYIVENKMFKYILITNCCNQIADNTDIETGGWRQLSCDFFPLKKYNIKKLFNYYTKEVSLIEL